MNAKKIENILQLSKKERYGYFIRKITDFEEVWSLYSDGWAAMADSAGRTVLPFWPEKEFAAICATEQWNGYKAECIPLDDFMNKWLPGMEKDNRLVNIFLIPGEAHSFAIEPRMLFIDLADEMREDQQMDFTFLW